MTKKKICFLFKSQVSDRIRGKKNLSKFWVKIWEVIDSLYLPTEKKWIFEISKGLAKYSLRGRTPLWRGPHVLGGHLWNRSILGPRKCFRQIQHHFNQVLFLGSL